MIGTSSAFATISIESPSTVLQGNTFAMEVKAGKIPEFAIFQTMNKDKIWRTCIWPNWHNMNLNFCVFITLPPYPLPLL